MGERLYRALLRLLPSRTRLEGERELIEIFLDGLSRARADGRAAVVRFWIVAVFDALTTAVAERRRPLRVSGFFVDVARALRNFLRAPARPALAVVTLAGGLSASLVAFVLVRDVLIRPLPYRQPGRIVRLLEVSDSGRGYWPSYPNCADWRRTLVPVFESVGCADAALPSPVIVDGRAIKATVARASRGLFETLGVQPSIGRLFTDDENRPGSAPASLISTSFWRNSLGSRSLVGLSIIVGDAVSPVVGVLPDDFAFLGDGGAWSRADVWTPLERDTNLGARTSHGYHTVARLRDGVTIEQARLEMPRLSAALKAAHREPTNADSIGLRLLADVVTRPAQSPMRVLTWAAFAVLLVSCLNFSAAVLARGLEQQRMMRLRLALGASRADLVRVALAEALALSVPAVLIGLALAAGAIRWTAASAAGALPRLDTLALDWQAVTAGIVAAAVCAVIAGLAPALVLSRAAIAGGLGSRGAVGGSRGTNRLWFGFVTLQIALTFVLLAQTGLLVRSFVEAQRVDLGYKTEDVVAVELAMPASRYVTPERRVALVRAVADALRAVPGVESVGVSNQLPTATSAMMSDSWIAGASRESSAPSAFRMVDPGYFGTLGIPVKVKLSDLSSGAAYVDETVARRLWKGAPPSGSSINHGFAAGTLRVAGLTGSVREWDQEDQAYGTVYAAYTDQARIPLTMYVFARGAAGSHVVEAAARRIDPFVSVTAAPLADAAAEPLRGRRLLVAVAVSLAGIACALACAGTYAMVLFAVRRRRREAAIRLALGARRSAVRREFVRAGMLPAVIGLGIGLILARPAGVLVAAQLFHVQPGDLTVMAFAAAALSAAAAISVVIPARRAARVDPVVLLRDE